MRRLIILLTLSILFNSATWAQHSYSIPAFTGYAVPNEMDEESLFQEGKGLQNWTDLQQEIQYFFYLKKVGTLTLELTVKNAQAGSVISVEIANKSFRVAIPQGNDFQKKYVGEVIIKDSGFYSIKIKGLKKSGKIIADLASLELNGSAAQGIHFNKKERRNAASVHLRYPISDTTRLISFYNEITIPINADIVHSYYMSNGFSRGYFGIQVNSENERRVIFSVWDAGNKAVSRSKVADSNKVILLAKGDGVFAEDFGNEGTGGHSHWVYPWKAGITYKMLVTALTDSASETTTYTGYFFLPEQQKWKLIASFRAPKDGKPLRNLYSFNENFVGINGQLQRYAYYGNQWAQRENGTWVELTESRFSYDATGKAGDRIDYGGGMEGGMFYLWNGGFKPTNTHFAELFTRPATNNKPTIDFTKNADSSKQASIDQQMIFNAIQQKRIDTMGNRSGVYYQIMKEGTGNAVSVTDTVTVFYKGYLLKDGTVFDQTKEKPATFPLNRLIKGWQLGLAQMKLGSKVQLIIPSGLAYTIRSRSQLIPPNSVLVFEIELVSLKSKVEN
jgi:FKBP-type peptidyl-prolyl cis-trans isomerase